MMNETSDPIEMLTIADDNVAIEEQLTRKKDGWVISLSLTSRCEAPVAVKVSVPMPSEAAMLETGFHPKHEPQNWNLDDTTLKFEDTVPADEPLLILLGLVPLDEGSVDLSLSEPTIEASHPVDSEADESMPEAPLFRSSSSATTEAANDDTEGPTPAAQADSLADSPEPDESTADTSEPGKLEFTTGEVEDDRDSDQPEVADAQPTGSIDMEFLESVSSESGADEEVSAGDDSGPGQTGMGEPHADSEQPSDMGSANDSVADPTSAETSGLGTETDRPVDVLSTLVDQLESSDPDDETLAALREHLAPDSRRSIDVRLEHIQSRMDDLAAYTDALEGFIDEHGTASDFMHQVESELEAIRSEMRTVKGETESANAAREELAERVSELESSLEEVGSDFRSRIENIYDDLDALRGTVEQHEDEVQSLESTINDHGADLEAVANRLEGVDSELNERIDDIAADLSSTNERIQTQQDTFENRLSEVADSVEELSEDMGAEIRQLKEAVDDLQEMRDVFAQAFANVDLEESVGDVDGEDTAAESEDPESEG